MNQNGYPKTEELSHLITKLFPIVFTCTYILFHIGCSWNFYLEHLIQALKYPCSCSQSLNTLDLYDYLFKYSFIHLFVVFGIK